MLTPLIESKIYLHLINSSRRLLSNGIFSLLPVALTIQFKLVPGVNFCFLNSKIIKKDDS